MDIPDLVRQELGDEAVRAGVKLGDEDVVCFTPTRTLVYRGEGLLSDEKVSAYPLDFERLAVSEGRRKTKFTLFYVDEKRELTVPLNRGEAVLERVLEGKLQTSGVLEAEESVTGVFRFSELTLVVTERQLLKHIGNATWDADFEQFHFDDITSLQFEEGSVATAIVVAFGDRPERIKAPNEQARAVRKALEDSVFAYHDVSSLDELAEKVGPDEDEDADGAGGLGLESGIDPLVSSDDEADADESDEVAVSSRPSGGSATESQGPAAASATTETSPARSTDDSDGDHDIAALESQVAELTEAVERQGEQIQQQEQTIKQLIKELRQGR
ncbi:hypothetical protein ACFQJ5_15675 [Halomicroarcula sp. GCM10025324]|uniref:DUF7115 domain-containing protein n=1 Tax=Haloarcula TaxID=2237 RepID=UPI0023E8DC42|nr:hypothetical protein [Halomicroarcula sp. ZS-22-S1]